MKKYAKIVVYFLFSKKNKIITGTLKKFLWKNGGPNVLMFAPNGLISCEKKIKICLEYFGNISNPEPF
jgi:hypothetical protein